MKDRDYTDLCEKNNIKMSDIIHIIINKALCIDAATNKKILQNNINEHLKIK
jgi:hypothetical protein